MLRPSASARPAYPVPLTFLVRFARKIQKQEQIMGLKGFIEDHPLPAITTLAISIASATAGVVDHLAKQHF